MSSQQQNKQQSSMSIARALALSKLALDRVAGEHPPQSMKFRELSAAKKVIGQLGQQYGAYVIRREE